MVRWTDLDQNPNASPVAAFIRDDLLRRRSEVVRDPMGFLDDFVRGQNVLDIGVVQHEITQADKPGWKHGRIKSVAARTVGIDVLGPEVEQLNERGYDVRLVDATSDIDLGERFDRVVVGDVLEHVENPAALLRFAGRHLNPGGLCLCMTPNPFFVGYFLQSLLKGIFVPNADHVAWISPSMALELGHRAGLPLISFSPVQGEGITVARKAAVALLKLFQAEKGEVFAPAFYYMYRESSEPIEHNAGNQG